MERSFPLFREREREREAGNLQRELRGSAALGFGCRAWFGRAREISWKARRNGKGEPWSGFLGKRKQFAGFWLKKGSWSDFLRKRLQLAVVFWVFFFFSKQELAAVFSRKRCDFGMISQGKGGT